MALVAWLCFSCWRPSLPYSLWRSFSAKRGFLFPCTQATSTWVGACWQDVPRPQQSGPAMAFAGSCRWQHGEDNRERGGAGGSRADRLLVVPVFSVRKWSLQTGVEAVQVCLENMARVPLRPRPCWGPPRRCLLCPARGSFYTVFRGLVPLCFEVYFVWDRLVSRVTVESCPRRCVAACCLQVAL